MLKGMEGTEREKGLEKELWGEGLRSGVELAVSMSSGSNISRHWGEGGRQGDSREGKYRRAFQGQKMEGLETMMLYHKLRVRET